MSKSHRGQRPKGYNAWNPTPDVAAVVAATQSVLAEYRQYGPMTVRQIFYRLVGQYGYPKDERSYKRLAEYLVKARRAQMIGFDRIRDDGTVHHAAQDAYTRADVWSHLRSIIGRPQDYLYLDKNSGQPFHLELWCEAAGMSPMLADMVRDRDIPVYSTGGFSSVTVTHEIAQRVLERDKPTYMLHIGDYDPSGESIFTSMSQDVGSFVSGAHGGRWNRNTGEVYELAGGRPCLFKPRRVALTEDQVAEFDLPTAPPKMSDSRSANWLGETTQAEAMPPTLLEEVVVAAVDELTDADALEDVREREKADRERLRAAVEDTPVTDLLDDLPGDASLLDVVDQVIAIDGQG